MLMWRRKEGGIVTGITVTKTDHIFQDAVAALIWSCLAAKYSKLVWQAEMELDICSWSWKQSRDEYGGGEKPAVVQSCWTVSLDAGLDSGQCNDKVTSCDKKLDISCQIVSWWHWSQPVNINLDIEAVGVWCRNNIGTALMPTQTESLKYNLLHGAPYQPMIDPYPSVSSLMLASHTIDTRIYYIIGCR